MKVRSKPKTESRADRRLADFSATVGPRWDSGLDNGINMEDILKDVNVYDIRKVTPI